MQSSELKSQMQSFELKSQMQSFDSLEGDLRRVRSDSLRKDLESSLAELRLFSSADVLEQVCVSICTSCASEWQGNAAQFFTVLEQLPQVLQKPNPNPNLNPNRNSCCRHPDPNPNPKYKWMLPFALPTDPTWCIKRCLRLNRPRDLVASSRVSSL